MIRKLQKRFILITMLSVLAVLSTIIVSINMVNYANIRQSADAILKEIIDNGGDFTPDDSDKPPADNDGNLTVETPYETRFFTVTYNESETVVKVNIDNIALIDAVMAVKFADSVVNSPHTKGYKEDYRYQVTVIDAGKMVVFMDCSRQLITAREFRKASVIICFVGVMGIFALVILFSKRIIGPMAKSYEKQKHFITDANHELKTPITIISANNELLELEYGENESTRSIAKQVERLTCMVKNLTLLSKIDERADILNKSDFSLSDTLGDLIESFSGSVQIAGKSIGVNIADGIVYNGDETLIGQMLNVLIDNAVKYSKNEINITLKDNWNKIELTISNDTYGVEQGNLDKYFDRFYRADSTRASRIEGSGIGLSIAKEIVELHKGKISAFSDDGVIFNIRVSL